MYVLYTNVRAYVCMQVRRELLLLHRTGRYSMALVHQALLLGDIWSCRSFSSQNTYIGRKTGPWRRLWENKIAKMSVLTSKTRTKATCDDP